VSDTCKVPKQCVGQGEQGMKVKELCGRMMRKDVGEIDQADESDEESWSLYVHGGLFSVGASKVSDRWTSGEVREQIREQIRTEDY
jgi:hypothetical protein